MLDGKAENPTESWNQLSSPRHCQNLEPLTTKVAPITNPQALRASHSQQGTPITSYWCAKQGGQENKVKERTMCILNGEAQVIISVVARFP